MSYALCVCVLVIYQNLKHIYVIKYYLNTISSKMGISLPQFIGEI